MARGCEGARVRQSDPGTEGKGSVWTWTWLWMWRARVSKWEGEKQTERGNGQSYPSVGVYRIGAIIMSLSGWSRDGLGSDSCSRWVPITKYRHRGAVCDLALG